MAEPAQTLETMNVDTLALCARGRRYCKEIQLASSANQADMNEHDFRRARANLVSLLAYLDFCQSQETMDSPEYHGSRRLPIAQRPAVIEVENDSINDLQRLYEVFDVELLNCPSSTQSNKFNSHDEKRLRAIVQRAIDYLDTYVSQILPLDLPETQPTRPAVQSGKLGVSGPAKA